MIDFATALELAQTVRAPLEQAFLQQIGKQAAEALVNNLSRLRVLIAGAISSGRPETTTSSSVWDLDSTDQEELAARILLAAKNGPDAFHDILTQYQVVKHAMNAGRSTGDISAMATGGSALTQTVVQGNYFHIVGHVESTIPIASPSRHPLCSAAARKLLSAAASDHGQVAVGIDYDNILQAGDLCIKPGAEPREEAKWKAALDELVSLSFLAPLVGSRGKIFQVTHRGYKFLDETASMSDSEL